MDREELRRQLMATFKVELEDHLASLNKGLLELEKGPSGEAFAELLAELFRAAHSIKGAARAVDLKDIETIAHSMEDVLGALKRGELSSSPELVDILLPAVDTLGAAMEAHLHGETLPAKDRENLLSSLTEALKRERPVSASPVRPGIEIETHVSSEAEKQRESESDKEIMEDRRPETDRDRESVKQESAEEGMQRPKMTYRSADTAAGDTIRVATEKLDTLMAGMGELLVARMRTEKRLEELKTLQDLLGGWEKSWRQNLSPLRRLQRQGEKNQELKALLDFLSTNETYMKDLGTRVNLLFNRFAGDYRHLSLLTDDMQDGVQRVRMVPVTSLFELFPRMVRDLGRERGKAVVLEIEGADTEIDRQVLEAMKDPLTHLLRNAVDHGIEKPDKRLAAGKQRQGVIHLSAFQKGNSIVLEVSDDGAGIDVRAVQRGAVERQMLTSADAAGLSKGEIIDLIFHSGFSTVERVTDLSGRGVGLDVVRQNLEQLHGIIEVESESGRGTTFTLTLPLTLATSHVLLLDVAAQTVAVPTTTVERILHIDPADVGGIEGRPAVSVNGRALPLIAMDRVLELPQSSQSLEPEQKIPAIILGVAEKRLAFRVDGFHNTQEVVIKSLGRQLSRVRNVAGATILGSGQVVMILNVAGLMKSAQLAPALKVAPKVEVRKDVRKRVLVVDDSITTRTLEKNILENAGYQVLVAADGVEGWALIQSEPLEAAVLDVDMPRMNGFELTQKIKGDERLEGIPVVLVTSLESPQDKIRGMEAGADAYIIKSTFDQQELLETIERLIG